MAQQSSLEKFFQDTRPVTLQFIMVGILVGGYSIIIIDSDIVFFDSYVLPEIAECYADNQNDFCTELREDHGCGMTEQACIGNVYWEQVNKQAIGLGAILFFARLIPSLIGHFSQGRKITAVTFFEAIWWGAMAIIVFLGGVIDYGYYVMRGMEVPTDLPWLNSVGWFDFTKTFTGDATVVNNTDLFLTMIISVLGLVALYLIAIFAYKQTNLKRSMA